MNFSIVHGPARRIAYRMISSPLSGPVVWSLYQLASGRARIDLTNVSRGTTNSYEGTLARLKSEHCPNESVTFDTGWVTQ